VKNPLWSAPDLYRLMTGIFFYLGENLQKQSVTLAQKDQYHHRQKILFAGKIEIGAKINSNRP